MLKYGESVKSRKFQYDNLKNHRRSEAITTRAKAQNANGKPIEPSLPNNSANIKNQITKVLKFKNTKSITCQV